MINQLPKDVHFIITSELLYGDLKRLVCSCKSLNQLYIEIIRNNALEAKFSQFPQDVWKNVCLIVNSVPLIKDSLCDGLEDIFFYLRDMNPSQWPESSHFNPSGQGWGFGFHMTEALKTHFIYWQHVHGENRSNLDSFKSGMNFLLKKMCFTWAKELKKCSPLARNQINAVLERLLKKYLKNPSKNKGALPYCFSLISKTHFLEKDIIEKTVQRSLSCYSSSVDETVRFLNKLRKREETQLIKKILRDFMPHPTDRREPIKDVFTRWSQIVKSSETQKYIESRDLDKCCATLIDKKLYEEARELTPLTTYGSLDKWVISGYENWEKLPDGLSVLAISALGLAIIGGFMTAYSIYSKFKR